MLSPKLFFPWLYIFTWIRLKRGQFSRTLLNDIDTRAWKEISVWEMLKVFVFVDTGWWRNWQSGERGNQQAMVTIAIGVKATFNRKCTIRALKTRHLNRSFSHQRLSTDPMKVLQRTQWGSHHVHKEYQKKNPIGLWALPLSVAADLDHLIFHHLICKKEREKRQVEPKTNGGTCRLTWELWCTVLLTIVRWRTEWTVEEEPRRWLWYHNFEVWSWR